jgi:hypothetical protein
MSKVPKTTCSFLVSCNLTDTELTERMLVLNQHFSKAGGPSDGIVLPGKHPLSCRFSFNFGSAAIAKVVIEKSKKKGRLQVEILGHLDLMRSYCRKVYKGDMEVLLEQWLTTAFMKKIRETKNNILAQEVR